MAHAEMCPVCRGTGTRKDNNIQTYTSAPIVPLTCNGCHGSGWVTVNDGYYLTTFNRTPHHQLRLRKGSSTINL